MNAGNFSLIGEAKRKHQSNSAEISALTEDTSYGIRGAYIFNKHLAVELSYQNYGEQEFIFQLNALTPEINIKTETASINLGVKGSLPIYKGLSLTGRFGLAYWKYVTQQTSSGIPEDNTDFIEFDFYYGVGGQYDINKIIFVGIEYNLLKLTFSPSTKHEIRNLSFTVGARF